MSETITPGKYIVLQRQKYTKLHKFANVDSCVTLGNDQIELSNVVDCQYFTTFRMVPKGNKGRRYELQAVDSSPNDSPLDVRRSGTDNRNIVDDGKSQKLTSEQIVALRDSKLSSSDIVQTLASNSDTFHSKTEYSQDKYIKKKQKKYFEYLTIKRPTIRMVSEIMYRQDPVKILNMRSDTLSQLISYSNINAGGHCLLYDSGTCGLVAAALLNSISPISDDMLIHMHPGNSCQKQAILSMNFDRAHVNKCISVNLYSVLRHFYQNDHASESNVSVDDEDGIVSKKRKLDNENNSTPIWILENERTCALLRNKVDSLVIVGKEHPLSIFKALVSFIKISKPFVIYNQYQEPIQDCYIALRKMPNITRLKMTSSWMREYQVLENRTHPDVLMQGNSGFLLTGWIVT